MMLAARGAFLAARRKPKMPYDAEVEYLESTGTQWIDTGIIGKDGITANTVLIVQGATSNSCVLGSFESGGARCWVVYMFGNVWRIGYNNANSATSSAVTVGTVYTISSHITNSAFSLIVNGDVVRTASYSSGFTTGLSMYMFAMNTSSGADYKARAKVYGCKIYDNATLVRDFIPVRFTNELGQSEGAMYDLANPTVGMNPDGSARTDGLYRNQGTDAFLYGSDKTAQEA